MIVIIDNFDSFTYNLVQRIGELDAGRRMEVRRHDAVGPADVEAMQPTHLIISPGPTSEVFHDGKTIFNGVTNPFTATRYHSLSIDPATLSDEFEVSAWTDRKELMGVRHKQIALEGVQFHPESFLTDQGYQLLSNFLGL